MVKVKLEHKLTSDRVRPKLRGYCTPGNPPYNPGGIPLQNAPLSVLKQNLLIHAQRHTIWYRHRLNPTSHSDNFISLAIYVFNLQILAHPFLTQYLTRQSLLFCNLCSHAWALENVTTLLSNFLGRLYQHLGMHGASTVMHHGAGNSHRYVHFVMMRCCFQQRRDKSVFSHSPPPPPRATHPFYILLFHEDPLDYKINFSTVFDKGSTISKTEIGYRLIVNGARFVIFSRLVFKRIGYGSKHTVLRPLKPPPSGQITQRFQTWGSKGGGYEHCCLVS